MGLVGLYDGLVGDTNEGLVGLYAGEVGVKAGDTGENLGDAEYPGLAPPIIGEVGLYPGEDGEKPGDDGLDFGLHKDSCRHHSHHQECHCIRLQIQ